MSNLETINKQLAAATEALAKVDADLAWQATGVAADIAGTIDPTPISDLVSAGVSVRNGDLWGAALSTVSMVPYLGDAVAKPVKAVRATKAIAGLTEKATALRKTISDLTKAKKEAEALAETTAKEAKIAKEADTAKTVAAQQEKSAGKKGKDTECCEPSSGKSLKKMKETPTDCFSAKKIGPAKADEFARQLKRQEEALNRLTVEEFLSARALFGKKPKSQAAQKAARSDYSERLQADLAKKNRLAGMSRKQAAEAATEKSKEIMKDLAALHEPDMIAGGKDIVTELGDKRVNSSIGPQWRTRVGALEKAAKDVPIDERASTTMNAKLPICK